MVAVPFENRQHVFRIARQELEGIDDYPDVDTGGRWIKIYVNKNVQNHHLERVSRVLREHGYHVSIERNTIKATKQDVSWPDTNQKGI